MANKFNMWESSAPSSWGVFIAASFPEDQLTVGNDKLPEKVHAVEAGFSKLHSWHQRDYRTKAGYCRSKESKQFCLEFIYTQVCSWQNIKGAGYGQTINFCFLALLAYTFLSQSHHYFKEASVMSFRQRVCTFLNPDRFAK